MSNKENIGTGLRGFTRLAIQSVVGITDLVEAMHRRVVHPPVLPSTPIQNLISVIAGITFNNIRWSTELIGRGLDMAILQLNPLMGKAEATPKKEAIRSVINGVIGDHLVKEENPLQILMQFRHRMKTIELDRCGIEQAYPKVNGKVLLMIHGSCLNDLHWTRKDHNHGLALGEELGKTPIYLHYNSGLHISTNGQNLSELLEELVSQWPLPLEELFIVAHSMGGLVARSAVYYGRLQEKLWPDHLKKIVFLGTPHHGASLERVGNYLDFILESIPYARPFAGLGKIRSAGVTDLRFGNLVDEDWKDRDRFDLKGDQRKPTGLPEKIECFSIAGSTGKRKNPISTNVSGDRLVSVKSALGRHRDPTKNLQFQEGNTRIIYESSHLDLLSNNEVYSLLVEWLD